MLVIDACGVGALPDAALYGDEGTNTLAHVAEAVGTLALPALGALGLGSILPLPGVPPAADPAVHGRLHPLGAGKDSVSGHWELMGVVAEQAMPTYPDGFPPEVIARLRAATGHELICNRPENGLTAIENFGAEHLRTGALIIYTSQDSVLQLAAHVDRMSRKRALRGVCGGARADAGRRRRGAGDRAAVQGPPGGVLAHGGPPRLRARSDDAQLPGAAVRGGRRRARGRQDRRPVRGRGRPPRA